jgi:hypothetical protein
MMVLEDGVGSRARVENREVIDSTIRAMFMIRATDGFIAQNPAQGQRL